MALLDTWIGLFRRLLPQLAKFGVIGVIGFVVDVGGFNLLRFAGGEGPLYDRPLTAKLVSTAAAVVVSWAGHRYWTFRQTRRDAVRHEFALFIVVSLIGIGISLGCLWLSHYVLGFRSALADNVSANGFGLVLATLFRFWALRTHVFSQDRSAPAAPAQPQDDASTKNSERPARRRI